MANVYDIGRLQFLDNTIDWATGDTTIGVILLDDGAAPNFTATHATVSAVLGHANNTELTGAGYARKYINTAANRNVINNSGTIEVRSDGTLFAALSQSAAEKVAAAVVYKLGTPGDLATTNDATTNIPICLCDMVTDISPNGGDLTIRWNAVDPDGEVFTSAA